MFRINFCLLATALFIAQPLPAVSAPKSPTRSDKEETLIRCLKAGGKLKICCAAVGGTYEPGKGGSTCTLNARQSLPSKVRAPASQKTKMP